MSLTNATIERFWKTMGERFGKRWLDEYGSQPTQAWRDALGGSTPTEIRAALDLMKLKGWQHPPTEPQFSQLLAEASRKVQAPVVDWKRGYWRSCVVSGFKAALGYSHEPERFEQLVVANKSTLGASMLALLDEQCDLETRQGQRTDGLMTRCTNECERRALSFVSLKRAA